MSELTVKPVRSKEDFREWLWFPWKVYQGNPNWVPPVVMDIKDILDVKSNPFWKHSRRELFLARRGTRDSGSGAVVGRIAAIIDDNHNMHHQEKMGFFGFAEFMPDEEAAKALLNEAAEWVKSFGMERLRGPVNPSMNDEFGFLVDAFDQDPAIMMAYTPAYYLDYAERAGFKKAKDVWAWYKSAAAPLPERHARILDKVAKRAGARMRPLEMKRFDKDLALIKELYNASWEHNWGFVPMTDDEMDYMAKKLKPLVRPELINFIEVNGTAVGMMLLFPDYNEVFKRMNGRLFPLGVLKFLWYKRKIRGLRLIALGVKKEYQGKGFDALFNAEALRLGRELGYAGGELSWTLEDNDLINRSIEAMGCVRTKTYRLVEKALS